MTILDTHDNCDKCSDLATVTVRGIRLCDICFDNMPKPDFRLPAANLKPMSEETRHGISKEGLEQLIAELNLMRADRSTQGEAIEAIKAAGLTGDTWLVQCLLYESESAIWAAWEAPE